MKKIITYKSNTGETRQYTFPSGNILIVELTKIGKLWRCEFNGYLQTVKGYGHDLAQKSYWNNQIKEYIYIQTYNKVKKELGRGIELNK